MVGGHSFEETKIAMILRQLQCGFGVAQGELNQQPECNSSPSYVQSNLISIDNKGLLNSLLSSHPISATSALPLLFFSFSFTLTSCIFPSSNEFNSTALNSILPLLTASTCSRLLCLSATIPILNLLDFIHSVSSFLQRYP